MYFNVTMATNSSYNICLMAAKLFYVQTDSQLFYNLSRKNYL